MATYVISDIHGYYDEFQKLLQNVNYSPDNDQLYILGDIIDRGPKSIEMIDWVMSSWDNVHMLRGNHEDMMISVLKNELNPDCHTVWETVDGYDLPWEWNSGPTTYHRMVEERNFAWRMDVLDWALQLPWYFDITVNEERFVMTHAGVLEEGHLRFTDDFDSTGEQGYVKIPGFGLQHKQILLWNRRFMTMWDDSWMPCRVIAGHTPTTVYANFQEDVDWINEQFNRGKILDIKGEPGYIFQVNRRIDIDCGNRKRKGMLRLEDMQEFYVDIQKKS